MYRIYWQSKSTGATGHGEPLPEALARAWLAALNAQESDITHWLELA